MLLFLHVSFFELAQTNTFGVASCLFLYYYNSENKNMRKDIIERNKTKKKKSAAPGLPEWSPTSVLTGPNAA